MFANNPLFLGARELANIADGTNTISRFEIDMGCGVIVRREHVGGNSLLIMPGAIAVPAMSSLNFKVKITAPSEVLLGPVGRAAVTDLYKTYHKVMSTKIPTAPNSTYYDLLRRRACFKARLWLSHSGI
jgi:hypothetical protein